MAAAPAKAARVAVDASPSRSAVALDSEPSPVLLPSAAVAAAARWGGALYVLLFDSILSMHDSMQGLASRSASLLGVCPQHWGVGVGGNPFVESCLHAMHPNELIRMGIGGFAAGGADRITLRHARVQWFHCVRIMIDVGSDITRRHAASALLACAAWDAGITRASVCRAPDMSSRGLAAAAFSRAVFGAYDGHLIMTVCSYPSESAAPPRQAPSFVVMAKAMLALAQCDDPFTSFPPAALGSACVSFARE